ncbi:MAG: FHA domain-containing protein [Deltaproteobacteria bacterium]|nr:FHA domain-containing protein [Deltaproteobacteria bacterium]
MSELPKNTAEAPPSDPEDNEELDEGGSTAVVRFPSVTEAVERTSPGVSTEVLGSEAIMSERSLSDEARATEADADPPTIAEIAGKEPSDDPSADPEVKDDPSELEDWSRPPSEAVQDPSLHTAVRKDVVGLDEAKDPESELVKSAPAKTTREGRGGGDLKATLDISEAERQEALKDDGWGGNTGTNSGTKSKIKKLEEPETGAMDQMSTQDAARINAVKDQFAKERSSPRAEEDEPQADPQEDPDAPRLICIQGPDLGKEFVLNGRDIAIGRAPGNDVIINDPSVSRTHCRLLIDQGQYVATDQRSGNGTIVDGRKIERQNLTSGSTIKLGQTILRFVEMGDVIKSTETESHKLENEHRSRIVAKEALAAESGAHSPGPLSEALMAKRDGSSSQKYALIIVALALIVGVTIVVWSVASRKGSGPDRSPPEIADEAYTTALLALKAKELDRAQEKLNLAIAAMPDEVKYKDTLDLVRKERGNLTALDEARNSALNGRYADALVSLAQVSKDTMFKNDVTAAKEEVRELVLQAVRKAIDGKDQETMAILARDIGETYKDEPDVKRLLERVSQKTRPVEVRHDDRPPPQDKPIVQDKPGPQEKPKPGAVGKALDTFAAGRADDALNELGSGGNDDAVALKNKISKFMDVYKDAKAQRAEAAIKKALAFESKITQGKSAYAVELRALHGDALIVSGTKALDQGRHLDAYKAFKEAQALQPENGMPKRKISEIQSQARDLVNKGYIAKDSDRAAARAAWERVLTMVPPDDEMYLKAKKWLDMTK